MNGFPFMELPQFLSSDQLQQLKEYVPVSGQLEPAETRCDGKNAETYHTSWLDHPNLRFTFDAYMKGLSSVGDNFGYVTHPVEQASYNVYNIYRAPDGGYPWHIDARSDFVFLDIKMTLIVNASTEPYEGGELHLAHHTVNDTHLKFMDEPGNAVLFRSHSLHRVMPVTKGERRSLTFFFTGPRWR